MCIRDRYFTVDMWLPEGTTIGETDRIAGEISDYIRTHEETEMVSSYIGRTPPRYYLSNISFGPQSNYAQLLVKCKSSKESRTLNALLQDSIRLKYPEPLIKMCIRDRDKQYFTVDMWLPEGTTIGETDRIAGEISDYIRTHEETEMVSSYIGRTPPRYYLSNISFGPQSNYAQLLVKCKSSKESRTLNALLQDSIRLKYPEPLIKVNKFELSPLTEAMIEARFLGPDPAVLDSLAGEAIEIMRRNPKDVYKRQS